MVPSSRPPARSSAPHFSYITCSHWPRRPRFCPQGSQIKRLPHLITKGSYPIEGSQSRWRGRALPDGLQTCLAEILQEYVVDVTARTEGRETLPVVDLSFADVEDDTVEGGDLAFVVRDAKG